MKQTETNYVVKYSGRAIRLTLVEETNGVARGRFANVKEIKKAPASAFSLDRFEGEILAGLANIEPLVMQARELFGVVEPSDYQEKLEAANIVYESYEEDRILAVLAKRRLREQDLTLNMLLRNKHSS